jgi:hypothetical protein
MDSNEDILELDVGPQDLVDMGVCVRGSAASATGLAGCPDQVLQEQPGGTTSAKPGDSGSESVLSSGRSQEKGAIPTKIPKIRDGTRLSSTEGEQ